MESAKLKIEAIEFITGSNCDQIGSVGVVDHVSTEFWNPYLEMSTVLSMQLNVTVVTEQGKLAVVI